ncbi:hypothetical protein EEL34_13865 [Muribaculaceae bacterium Isolate-039 (Harlan)]|jgi:hypothetical protein|uniref:hypothetical protein n=1 Tax=Duncaniella sp. C9 TaxID=2530392 RepID=UPI000F536962|nr:hypothetical protein [Duncaniella sp. C9]QCD39710.1 hypothetical protein E7745_09310 [Duncaniella sp. C9]ROS83680.1 hypothetical protein EEL34_13865 [Muribaculaceae bacterium Isolate-039 (Harlan)]
MIFERVNFNDEEIKKMSRDEFESRHINLFWLDRDEATRKKILGQVYDLITKPAKRTKQKAE